MKKTILISLALCITISIIAQDKKEMKKMEQEYGVYAHKKFFARNDWAMCKFSFVYKLSTAMTVKTMDKNKEVGAKVKSSSGAYAVLNGITDDDLQNITNQVAENFIKRMKEEANVNITTWSSFESSENTNKIKEMQEDRELYSRSQGLAYAMTYDNTPHYNRVLVLIPDGKKLSKELDKNVMEFTMYIDFADIVATANADVSITGRTTIGNTKTTYFSWSESADQRLYPGVRLVPNLGSEALSEMGKNLGTTSIKGHDKYGYMFSMNLLNDMVSDVSFVDEIIPNEGKVPEILANRKNNKMEYVKTFDVYTSPEKYANAVMDVTNQYFDKFIKIYNYENK